MPPKSKSEVIGTIKKRLSTNITDSDLRRYFPNADENTIVYSDLSKYSDIQQLLPHDRSYKIILIETTDHNVGHWTAIMRYADTIESFDSYGSGKLENEFKFIPKKIRQILGETTNYLQELLKKAKRDGFKIVYNRDRLQADHDGVNTCGRWCILRILMMKEMGYDLKSFCEFMDDTSEETGKPPDVLVCEWIH
jgi:hypothetical protein